MIACKVHDVIKK